MNYIYTIFSNFGMLNMTENNEVNSYIQEQYSISCYIQCSYNIIHLLDGVLRLTGHKQEYKKSFSQDALYGN
jgi:hypothetical protein